MNNYTPDCTPVSDYITPEGYKCVSNVSVFGLGSSIRGAKFPMSTNLLSLDKVLTPGIEKLAKSPKGEGHDQWLTGVVVQFDLSFSNKAWVEMERYHFVDFVSSQSTMHRISKFNLSNLYNDYVDERIISIMRRKIKAYNEMCERDDIPPEEKADLYLEILYNNPAGCIITARMTTNYRQLKTIYAQRKNHRLPEWRDFCDWIKTLPMSELITEQN